MNRYKLFKAGVDVNEGLKRVNDDKAFYESLLIRFCENSHYDQMKQAMEQNDVTLTFQHAHALKGAAGNLSLIALEEDFRPFVEALREGNLEKARDCFPKIQQDYELLQKAVMGDCEK